MNEQTDCRRAARVHVMFFPRISSHRAQFWKPFHVNAIINKAVFSLYSDFFRAMRPRCIYTKTIRLLALV